MLSFGEPTSLEIEQWANSGRVPTTLAPKLLLHQDFQNLDNSAIDTAFTPPAGQLPIVPSGGNEPSNVVPALPVDSVPEYVQNIITAPLGPTWGGRFQYRSLGPQIVPNALPENARVQRLRLLDINEEL